MNRIVMHLDMDAFFAAVEELADPSLMGRPLVVAGPGDRSVVTTASYPARSFGIRTGMTAGQAKALCGDLKVLKADYRKYSHASRIVMAVLESFTPQVHVLSVDEAFMDISDLARGPVEAAIFGRRVKDEVLRKSGLTCSIGIAPGRLIAKLASTMDKPDGMTIISQEEIKDLLEKTHVAKLCGIGQATAEKLASMGIVTCGQLGRYPLEPLRKCFGVLGEDLSRMGRGLDPSGNPLLGEKRETARSIGHSVTLPNNLTGKKNLEPVILTLSEMVGRRLRRHGGVADCLTLTWRYDDFSTHSRRRTYPAPVNLTKEIYSRTLAILSSIELKRPVRLLGISLSGLTFGSATGCLLEEDRKTQSLQEAMDWVNDRYGEFSLAFAGSIGDLRNVRVISPAWRAKGIRNSF
jgi:DNA polymerase-4